MNYRIGDKVGGYEVTGVLGAGGMGEIYEVRNVISDRAEAMKVLLSDLRAEAELAERFIREIKLQARLRHANIAGLHTAFEADHQLVMIMELVEGQTLSALLARSRLAVSDTVAYMLQALAALEYAHSQGVVHRDIKPSNIMVTPGGAVKLMDFGIAKAMKDKSLTRTGNLIGSLHYMSPEQVRGDAGIDGRTDIYSLGVVVYEMVTGRKPFDGNSEFSIMRAHLEQPPVPPEQIDASISPGLSAVILAAMAKDRGERYQTAGEFLDELKRFGASEAPRPPSAPVPREVSREATAPPKIDPEITGYLRPAAGAGLGPAPPLSSGPDETTISGRLDPQITGYLRRPEPAATPTPPASDAGSKQASAGRSRLRTISGERAALRDLPEAPPEPAVRRVFPKVAIGIGIAAALAVGFLVPGWLSHDSLDGGEAAIVAEAPAVRPAPTDVAPAAETRETARAPSPSPPPSTTLAPSTRQPASNPPPPRPAAETRSIEPAPKPLEAAARTPPPPAVTPVTAPPSEPAVRTPAAALEEAVATVRPGDPPPAAPQAAPPAAAVTQPDPPAPRATPPPAAPPKPAAPDPDRVYTIKEPGVSPPQMVH
ncbi:MAG TPA: serine/threonine-protein kinase, partial [Bryobacterales bacterium]|nr:serine/threonine-protein kinase [Bryobacterales bacterium]